MNVRSIVEAVIAGLTTALAWAVALWVFNFCRNLKLRKQLKRVFSKHSVAYGIDGFGLGLRNHTSIPVIVRDVRFYKDYPNYAFVLNYIGATQEVIDEKIPKTKKVRVFDKNNPDQTVRAWPYKVTPPLDERGFVVLPPETGGDWRIPKNVISSDMRIDAVRVVIEYTTLFGKREIVPIMASQDTVKFVSESFEKVKNKRA